MATPWWKNAVIYQIYPRSFKDTNSDGIGDLKGVIEKLPYLHQLGIDAIWLSPVYPSPNVDNGYDISNYQDIHPDFGSLEDMTKLIEEAKKLGIRIIMDLVLNHTSDQHEWFLEAKKSKDNPHHHDYIWSDPVDGHEPNDTPSTFGGGSAWTYVPELDQYYFHLFSPQQPDLNWENEEVRKRLYEMIRFWIDLGVSGFRLDVIELIGKKPFEQISANGPMLHPYIHELYKEAFQNREIMTVGEVWSANPETAKLYTNEDREELSMIFEMEHLTLSQEPGKSKWYPQVLNVSNLRKIMKNWQDSLDGKNWLGLALENHDVPRVISVWGDENYEQRSGKLFAILFHLLKGTPFIYEGEEIGMTNYPFQYEEELNDVEEKNFISDATKEGWSRERIFEAIRRNGRDNARTPMQWEETKEAGFTDGTPWLKVNPNYKEVNAQKAVKDKQSIFYTYQKLIQLRHEEDLITNGEIEFKDTKEPLIVYKRYNEEKTWWVIANVSSEKQSLSMDEQVQNIVIQNVDHDVKSLKDLKLDPWEIVVVEVKS